MSINSSEGTYNPDKDVRASYGLPETATDAELEQARSAAAG